MRRGRAGKLPGVAEPAGADARVRDAGKRYDVGDVESYREVRKVFEVTSSSESMSP